jgi:hypothetical protein
MNPKSKNSRPPPASLYAVAAIVLFGWVFQGRDHLAAPHLVAMTGSYFRGDAAPVLAPEEENRFEAITYTLPGNERRSVVRSFSPKLSNLDLSAKFHHLSRGHAEEGC